MPKYLLTEFKCIFCVYTASRKATFSRHLKEKHNVNPIQFTIDYLLDGEIPKCLCGCGEEVRVVPYGVNEYCFGHTSIAGTKGNQKRAKIQNSNNPLDWKILCEECGEDYSVYQSFLSYRSAMGRISEGKHKAKCKKCKRKAKLGTGGRRRKYNNDNNWTLTYSCGCEITQNSYNAYRNRKNKLDSGGLLLCISCAQKGKPQSEEKRKKMRERIITAEEKVKRKESRRLRELNMTSEERERRREYQAEVVRNTWNNMSEEEKEERRQRRIEWNKNMPLDQRIAINQKLRQLARKRMEEWGGLHEKFAPGYNPDTIPYIVDILNIKYDTEFRHAESESGEFKIYDKEFQRFYYADAYCERQNIWIEFDEDWHFNKNGELKEDCQLREERIRYLLNCQLLRVQFNKKLHLKRNFVNT